MEVLFPPAVVIMLSDLSKPKAMCRECFQRCSSVTFIFSGHEAAFAAFLCCLCKVEALRVDDQLAIVLKVFNRWDLRIQLFCKKEKMCLFFLSCLIFFLLKKKELKVVLKSYVCIVNAWTLYAVPPRYLSLMRKLQRTYRMEPAGSQGVWGLDDFQFLPFIWGSSQFLGETFKTDLQMFFQGLRSCQGWRWTGPVRGSQLVESPDSTSSSTRSHDPNLSSKIHYTH